jgi:hypothetical protein
VPRPHHPLIKGGQFRDPSALISINGTGVKELRQQIFWRVSSRYYSQEDKAHRGHEWLWVFFWSMHDSLIESVSCLIIGESATAKRQCALGMNFRV